jgi:hemolysin activation/secretion protein
VSSIGTRDGLKAGLLIAGVSAALSGMISLSWAQTNLPAGEQPGRIEKRFEPPRLPQSVIEPTIPETPEPLPPEQADRIRFTLTGVTVEGARVYSEAEFLPLYQDLLGKDVTLSDIYKVADGITAKYHDTGHPRTRAVLPPQHISSGIVRIRVVEGDSNSHQRGN